MKTSLGRTGRKCRESWFVVNKIHLFIVLIIFLVINSGLFLFSFIISLLFFIRGIITAKIPIEPNESFYFRTYTYKQIGNTALKLDIWYPNQKKAVYPFVFFAHGGGWVSGFRKQRNNISWCKFVASKGFAAPSINYRLAIEIKSKNILCKLLIHKEGGHGFETHRNDFHTIRILDETIRFMKSVAN